LLGKTSFGTIVATLSFLSAVLFLITVPLVSALAGTPLPLAHSGWLDKSSAKTLRWIKAENYSRQIG
jgi:hypothetical protein